MKQVHGISLIETLVALFITCTLLLTLLKSHLLALQNTNQMITGYRVLLELISYNPGNDPQQLISRIKKFIPKATVHINHGNLNTKIEASWTHIRPLFHLCNSAQATKNCIQVWI